MMGGGIKRGSGYKLIEKTLDLTKIIEFSGDD